MLWYVHEVDNNCKVEEIVNKRPMLPEYSLNAYSPMVFVQKYAFFGYSGSMGRWSRRSRSEQNHRYM